MRVLLINPYYPISETPSPPLGLAYLAAMLERSGIEVKVLDFVVYPYSRDVLEQALNEFYPQMAGLTSVTMTFDHATQIVKDLKAIDPDIVTVIGGPHVTFRPLETLNEIPEIDIIVMGEGESAIVSLTKELAGKRDWSKVASIAYRQNGEVQVSRISHKPLALDQLPRPSRHLLPLNRYRALGMPLTMTTSRGCPFRCIFCVGRKMGGNKVRFRRPEDVVDELDLLSRLGFPQINIADDLFTASTPHCLSTCDGIIQRRLFIKWAAFSRVDTITPHVLERMRLAGCHTISFGVESANPKILRTIRKGITTGQVVSAVKMCVDAGISPHASFILGLPGETPSTIKETREFAEALKDMGASYGFHLLAPFPGTEVREKAKELGIRILTNDWSRYHANRAVVETRDVSKEMMDSIVKEWEEKFLAWLGDIERKMRIGAAPDHEIRQYKKLRHCSILYELMMNSSIENHGLCPPAPQSSDPLKALVQKLEGKISYGKDETTEALSKAVEQGVIKSEKEGGLIRWRWT